MNCAKSIAALLLFVAGARTELVGQAEIHTLINSGPTDRLTNVVFLSEGYTAEQLPQFLEDARDVAKSLLDEPPYVLYRNYFNVFAIAVASREEGSDHPSRGIEVDTYFDSFYDCAGIGRLICLQPSGDARVHRLLEQFLPEYDAVGILVNDPQWGGSGGRFTISSARHREAGQLFLHELGHSIAGLVDEYDTSGGVPREGPNTTAETRREAIKWRVWIEDHVPVPTPDAGEYIPFVGLFEGAAYRDRGWYRPKTSCKMRDSNRPFCEVCKEQHIMVFHQLVNPVSSFAPDTAGRIALVDEEIELSASFENPPEHQLEGGWFLNGRKYEDPPEESFAVSTARFGPGAYVVEYRIEDKTNLVRNPTKQAPLRESVAWRIEITGIPPGEDQITLQQPYPNPVSGRAMIRYRLREAAETRLSVFNPLGQEVARLVDGPRDAGTHIANWNALDETNSAAGTYLVRLYSAGHSTTRIVTVVR